MTRAPGSPTIAAMAPLRSLAPAAIGVALAAASLPLASCGDDRASAAAPGVGPRSAYLASRPIQAVGGKVSFGTVKPCGGTVSRTERIRNQSSEPVEILAYASNCGCLKAKLLGDRTVRPGEEREIELTVHPSGHGERSISVEFASKDGFAGALRVDFSLNSGVVALPTGHEIHPGDRDAPVDAVVRSTDGAPIKVLSIDPPVGTVERTEGGEARIAFSTYEAARFAASEAGRLHPGIVLGAGGKAESLTVTIVTDHADCPTATFDFIFPR